VDGRHVWAGLAMIVLVALALRVVVAAGVSRDRIAGDPAFYDLVGVSVAASGTWPRLAGQPTALHPPAWPYVLGATYAATGHGRASDRRRTALSVANARWRAGRMVNALFGAAAVALSGMIATFVWGSTVGLIAAGLAAVYPPAIALGATLYSEPLFVALALGALLAVVQHRRSARRWRWVLLAGGLTGLAILARANGAVLLVPLALGAWTARPRRSPQALAAPAALIATAALAIAPWTVRNLVVLHAIVPVSTNLGKTLAGTYNPVAQRHRFRWTTGRLLPTAYRPALEQPSEPARSAALTRLALAYIRRHPLAVAKAGIWNTARLAELDAGGRSVLASGLGSRRLAHFSIGGFAVTALLAAAGAFTRRARAVPGFFWLIPALLWLTTVVTAAQFSRFRAPLDPFVVMLAALGVVAIAERLRPRRIRVVE
jgi:4-amino-4-deoxy-L-arabinose transferase-like glycosyltransferase